MKPTESNLHAYLHICKHTACIVYLVPVPAMTYSSFLTPCSELEPPKHQGAL